MARMGLEDFIACQFTLNLIHQWCQRCYHAAFPIDERTVAVERQRFELGKFHDVQYISFDRGGVRFDNHFGFWTSKAWRDKRPSAVMLCVTLKFVESLLAFNLNEFLGARRSGDEPSARDHCHTRGHVLVLLYF